MKIQQHQWKKGYESEAPVNSESENETIHKNILVNKEKLKNMFQNEIKCKACIVKMISFILKDVENKMKKYIQNGIIRKEICEETCSIFKNIHKK